MSFTVGFDGSRRRWKLPQPPRPIVPAGLALLDPGPPPFEPSPEIILRRFSPKSSDDFLRLGVLSSSVGNRLSVTLVGS